MGLSIDGVPPKLAVSTLIIAVSGWLVGTTFLDKKYKQYHNNKHDKTHTAQGVVNVAAWSPTSVDNPSQQHQMHTFSSTWSRSTRQHSQESVCFFLYTYISVYPESFSHLHYTYMFDIINIICSYT